MVVSSHAASSKQLAGLGAPSQVSRAFANRILNGNVRLFYWTKYPNLTSDCHRPLYEAQRSANVSAHGHPIFPQCCLVGASARRVANVEMRRARRSPRDKPSIAAHKPTVANINTTATSKRSSEMAAST